MKILIVEDDLASRNFLGGFLQRYEDCDLVVDGLEALDAFGTALKDGKPYQLIFLDITMSEIDGLQALKTIRNLEKQYHIAPEQQTKIIITTALDEEKLVRVAFDHVEEACAAKPIDTNKLIELMENPELIAQIREEDYRHIPAAGLDFDADQVKGRYFKYVHALSDYRLEVTMETGTTIRFNFQSRLNTARFGKLRDETMFRNVHTDGNYLIFVKPGSMPVKITASEFMDLVLIDRTR